MLWPDSTLDDYLHRDKAIKGLTLCDLVKIFMKVYKTFKQMNQQEVSDEMNKGGQGIVDSDLRLMEYPFIANHPGHEFSYLQQRKFEVIPVILMPKGSIYRIEELEMSADSPTAAALNKQENYAKTALLMFLLFCCTDDLRSKTDNTHWTKLMEVVHDGTFDEI